MKKYVLGLAAIGFVFAALTFQACKKDVPLTNEPVKVVGGIDGLIVTFDVVKLVDGEYVPATDHEFEFKLFQYNFDIYDYVDEIDGSYFTDEDGRVTITGIEAAGDGFFAIKTMDTDWETEVIYNYIVSYYYGMLDFNQNTKNYYESIGYRFTLVPRANEVTVENAVPSASVNKLNGNKNELTVTVTEYLSDGTTNVISEVFSINSNSADTYEVGAYRVYVDTKGNDQIRQCYIVN